MDGFGINRLFVLFSLFFGGMPAHADQELVGKGLIHAKREDYPYVCDLTAHLINHTSVHCTGTLVSQQKIYTAAHCFGRKFDLGAEPVDVNCGGASGAVIRVVLPDPLNDAIWPTDTVPLEMNDFAIVSLNAPLKNHPSPVAKGPQMYFDANGNLLPGVKCRLMGYGYSDIDSGNLQQQVDGKLVIANLDQVKIVFATPLIETLPLSGALLATSVNHGDSGGPLFCAAPPHDFEFLGVVLNFTSQAYNDLTTVSANTINPVWLHRRSQ